MVPSPQECKDFLLSVLGQGYRYEHSLKVATYACNLAQSFPQINIQHIEIAALLHDVAKNLPHSEASHYLPPEYLSILAFPPVVHAYVGSFMVTEKLGVKDPEILDAIMYHTTGKKEMSIFALIIYIADFAASLKDEDEKLVQDILDTAIYNTKEIAFQICKDVLTLLVTSEKAVHQDTVAMYNWLIDSSTY